MQKHPIRKGMVSDISKCREIVRSLPLGQVELEGFISHAGGCRTVYTPPAQPVMSQRFSNLNHFDTVSHLHITFNSFLMLNPRMNNQFQRKIRVPVIIKFSQTFRRRRAFVPKNLLNSSYNEI